MGSANQGRGRGDRLDRAQEDGSIMKEAGVLLDLAWNPIFWHTPQGRSGGSLPDSQDLWAFIWENRDRISGFGHTHPGYGVPGPSQTDLTTFTAIEEGLGKRLDWWIVSGDRVVLVTWYFPWERYVTRIVPGKDGQPEGFRSDEFRPETRYWSAELRRLSGFGVNPK